MLKGQRREMRERNREKEEWRSELGFGEGEKKFWVSGLILPQKIEIGFFLADFFLIIMMI